MAEDSRILGKSIESDPIDFAIRNALFGDGTATGSIISSVYVGGNPDKLIQNPSVYDVSPTAKQNSLERMRDVLTALGITHSNENGHFNHFHLNIDPPQRVDLNNLLAAGTVLAAADTERVAILPTETSEKYDAAFSVCGPAVPVDHRDFTITNLIYPLAVIPDTGEPTQVTLLEGPHHGSLTPDADFPNSVFVYHPNDNYLGPDHMTFVVDVMGKKFKVIMTVWVANTPPEYGGCPPDYDLPPADTGDVKGSALDIIELPVDSALDADALAKLHAFVNFAEGAGLGGNVDITFADLPGGAVGHNQ